MENIEKNELMDVTTAALLIGSILERFAGQQLLTSAEQQALEYSQEVHLNRRKALMNLFNIDEKPAPAPAVENKEPAADQKGGSGNPWP